MCADSPSSRWIGFSPNSQNSTGVSRVSSSVELIRPPKITTATGCRISLPGASAAEQQRHQGEGRPTSAVISTGVSRSSDAAHDHRLAEDLALEAHRLM